MRGPPRSKAYYPAPPGWFGRRNIAVLADGRVSVLDLGLMPRGRAAGPAPLGEAGMKLMCISLHDVNAPDIDPAPSDRTAKRRGAWRSGRRDDGGSRRT